MSCALCELLIAASSVAYFYLIGDFFSSAFDCVPWYSLNSVCFNYFCLDRPRAFPGYELELLPGYLEQRVFSNLLLD